MQYVNENESHSISWDTLGTLLRRYRWVILVVFLFTVVTGWGVLQIFFTDLYETQAVILVKVGRETSEIPSTMVSGSLLSQGVRIQDINSEVQMLSASFLVEAAIDKMGPDLFKSVLKAPDSILGYPKYWLKMAARELKGVYKEALYALNLQKRLTLREEVILGVVGSLKLEPIKESDVLVLKLRLPSPELAVRTAEEILQGYLKRRGSFRHNPGAREYFDQQTQFYRAQMNALGKERAKVRESWGLSSAGEQRSLLLKQLSDLEGERIMTAGQIRKLEQERMDMLTNLARMPAKITKEETFSRNPTLQSFRERITNLQMERAKLLGRYQPGSELVNQVETEISTLEKSLERESPTVLAVVTSENNPLRKEFEKGVEERAVAIAGLQMRALRLEEPQGAMRKHLDALNQGSDDLERVERDYRVAEQTYLAFHKRMGEAKLSEGMDSRDVANVSVISSPNLPMEPVYPRKLFIMGMLLPVALLLGIGIAALMESMNDRIRNESDLILIPGVAYLGSIEKEGRIRLSEIS